MTKDIVLFARNSKSIDAMVISSRRMDFVVMPEIQG